MGTKLLGYPRSTNRSFRIIRLLLPIQLDAVGNAVIFAGEDVVFAQWIADPIVGAENAPQVRVAIEDDAIVRESGPRIRRRKCGFPSGPGARLQSRPTTEAACMTATRLSRSAIRHQVRQARGDRRSRAADQSAGGRAEDDAAGQSHQHDGPGARPHRRLGRRRRSRSVMGVKD